jgi:uncharacterized protein (TIGR03437 family)
MSNACRLFVLWIATAVYGIAAPEIRWIVNAASYALPGSPNSAIAQGSIFVIFGTDLGPVTLEQAASFPLPTSLGGTSVQVTSGSTTLDAPLLYVWEQQVAAILPSPTPPGIAFVSITSAGRMSQAGAIRVVPSSPGILTQNQAGNGIALAQNFTSESDQPRNSLDRPARPGQTVVLWATGLGPVTDSDAAQPVPRDLSTDIQVLVGGRSAAVRYKGRSRCCPGADQINFDVPGGVSGCYVPVVVRAGGATSNFATISIAQPGTDCMDVSGLTGPEIERLQNGGELRVGFISLVAAKYTEWSGEAPGYYEYGNADFSRASWDLLQPRLSVGRPSPGSCVVSPAAPSQGILQGRPTPLEAGPAVNIAGPKGTRQLPRRAPGVYNESFATAATQLQYLEPGSYTFENGSGGAEVGAFRTTISIPAALSTTVQQSPAETTVTWRGGDPTGVVGISGYAPGSFPWAPASFICTERVAAGRFTVPAYVLGSLQPGLTFTIGVTEVPQNRFRAPGLDLGLVSFSYSEY